LRVLLAYYSRTGSTAEFAELIKSELATRGAQVDEMRLFRAKERGFLISGYQGFTRAKPAIVPPAADVAGCDVVVLGFPTWAGRPASPFNSLVAGLKNPAGPRYALFATSGTPGGYRAGLDLAARDISALGGTMLCDTGLLGKDRDQMPAMAREFALKILGS
jgi:flavodoxin